MKSPHPPIVQISLDLTDINEAIETARIALEAGVDWLEAGTPLILAARYGGKEMVEFLIARGANINATNFIGLTSLHEAANYGHREIVELLIAKGADVNASGVNKNGNIISPPIVAASYKGHLDILKLLFSNGAGEFYDWVQY